jgi:hypothetical protein
MVPTGWSPSSRAGTTPERTHLPGAQAHGYFDWYARDAKSELFLLAVTNMVSEDAFYEKAGSRDGRYERLVRQVAVEDAAWILPFLAWLRGDAGMRSASLVGAADAVKARLDAAMASEASEAAEEDGTRNRQLVDAVLR